MRDAARPIVMDGGFSADELAVIAASLVGADPAQVCAVAMVVTLHSSSGEHEVRLATTIENNPRDVAYLLRHAADHTHGGCDACRARNERRKRRERN